MQNLKRGMTVYVAGPYSSYNGVKSGNIIEHKNITLHNAIRIVQQNTDRAIDVGIRLLKLGFYHYIPHLSHYIHARMDEDLGEAWYDIDSVWLDKCDAILLMKDWQISKGAVAEFERAKKNRMILLVENDLDSIERRQMAGGD